MKKSQKKKSVVVIKDWGEMEALVMEGYCQRKWGIRKKLVKAVVLVDGNTFVRVDDRRWGFVTTRQHFDFASVAWDRISGNCRLIPAVVRAKYELGFIDKETYQAANRFIDKALVKEREKEHVDWIKREATKSGYKLVKKVSRKALIKKYTDRVHIPNK